jgi:hypothetical protein
VTEDVLGYLHRKGIQTKRASADEVHIPCMFCGEDDNKRGRLYVNINGGAEIPGLFFCHLCGAKGSLVSLQRHFGDATETQEREDTSYKRRNILQLAADFYHEALDDHPEVVRYLVNERGLTPETIARHKLGFAGGEVNALFRMLRQQGYASSDISATGLTTFHRETGKAVDFLRNHITIPYQVAANVVMIRGRAFGATDEGSKYVTGIGQKARLFNTDSVWDADEVMVTEGEFDCLVLEQQGYSAVAVPGANSWQEEWDAYFSGVRRIWVVFDRDANDDIGGRAAEKVVSRLGPKARNVQLPEHENGKKNDVTEWFVNLEHTRHDFEQLVKAARGVLVAVEDAIATHAVMASLRGMKFGIPQLDALISPGLLPSQIMVVNANTGSGKTLFLVNAFRWIAEAQPEWKILFVSLEQTAWEWWERARRIHRFFEIGSDDMDAERFYHGRLLIDERNRVSPDQFLQVLDDFEMEMGAKPDVVAVDYLGYWARSFPGDRYERTSDAVMTMKEIAKSERLRLLTPNQVSRSAAHGTDPGLQSGRDSGVVEETSDFLLTLWRPDTTQGKPMEEQRGDLNMAIAKSRHGGAGWIGHFVFAPLSLAVVTDNSGRYAQMARDEYFYRTRFPDESWEDCQVRHRLGVSREMPWTQVKKEDERSNLQQIRGIE